MDGSKNFFANLLTERSKEYRITTAQIVTVLGGDIILSSKDITTVTTADIMEEQDWYESPVEMNKDTDAM